MCDHWMPNIKLPVTIEQFHQLPRNPAYRYEYSEGMALLTPRAKVYHAALKLAEFDANPRETLADGIAVGRMHRRDLPALIPLFSASFRDLQPFGCLDDATRLRAAKECLTKTTSNVDGPWVRVASFVATEDANPVGAILITLMPDGDPCDWDAFHWSAPPPRDLLRRRGGQPHVTWIFVSPWHKGTGVGTALLGASIGVLRKLGYRELLTTFFSSNDSSMLWHWRSGFRLLAYPGSRRRLRSWIQDVSADLKK